MSAFADTSFICALHVPLVHSPKAIDWCSAHSAPILVSALVEFEFRQSVRLQVFRHRSDKTCGFAKHTADAALSKFESNLAAQAFIVMPLDWNELLRLAERISAQYTVSAGYRALDVLHAATAQLIGAKQVLSFDVRQRELAVALGLEASP